MTPNDWNAMLAPEMPWQTAYAAVERMARLHLEMNVLIEAPVTTAQLVEALYPERDARGPDAERARARMFKALQALATHGLAGYCHRDKPRKNKLKQTMRPWLWHPIGYTPKPGWKIGDQIDHDGAVWRCIAVMAQEPAT